MIFQLVMITPFSPIILISQIAISMLVLSFKYLYYRISRQLYILVQNFLKWQHIVDSVLPINYIISTFEVRTHNLGIYNYFKIHHLNFISLFRNKFENLCFLQAFKLNNINLKLIERDMITITVKIYFNQIYMYRLLCKLRLAQILQINKFSYLNYIQNLKKMNSCHITSFNFDVNNQIKLIINSLLIGQNQKVRELGIRNSDEFKNWMDKLIIINKDDKQNSNKNPQSMKKYLITRHIQLVKDTKYLKKIREKVNENQILFAEQEDETTYRFEITPIFMADSPLLLISFEDITLHQKSNKKKNEQLNLCSMMFDNLKYISCRLENSIQAVVNQKIHPKLGEIQKISQYLINQLLIFANIPSQIPLQKFKFKDIISPIQNLYTNYEYKIEDNIGEVNINSNVLLFKYCIMSLFSCFESSKSVNIILKNVHSKYILIEIQTNGQFSLDLLKKMNLSSNDLSSRKQISLFQKYVKMIGPQEIQIMFNSKTNLTQIFLSLYINLEEKSLEQSQNWYNFIHKTQSVLTSTQNKSDIYNGEKLNGLNQVNHSYLTTLNNLFLNDKFSLNSQKSPKMRAFSLSNNKGKNQHQLMKLSSLSLHQPKNEILEKYTHNHPNIQENLSEIKSVASVSNLNDQDGSKFNSKRQSISSSKNIQSNYRIHQEANNNNPKSIFSNHPQCIQTDNDNDEALDQQILITEQEKSSEQKINVGQSLKIEKPYIDYLTNKSEQGYKNYKRKMSEKGKLSLGKISSNGIISDHVVSPLSIEQNYIDLYRNQQLKDLQAKNSYLSLSCKSIQDEKELKQQKNLNYVEDYNGQRFNKYKQNTNDYDIENGIMQQFQSPQNYNKRDYINQNEVKDYKQNGTQISQNGNNYDRFNSTSSRTFVSQKQHEEFVGGFQSNNSISNSVIIFNNDSYNSYQYQKSNINFEDKNKFQQPKQSLQSVKIM